jgi:hypothetical protein
MRRLWVADDILAQAEAKKYYRVECEEKDEVREKATKDQERALNRYVLLVIVSLVNICLDLKDFAGLAIRGFVAP